MNNPYPTKAQLRTERIASRLLREQAAGEAAFRRIVSKTMSDILLLHLPLGCPAPGYDPEDVIAMLGDWLRSREPDALELLARDAAERESELV